MRTVPCPTCGGTGVRWTQHSMYPVPYTCKPCRGTGRRAHEMEIRGPTRVVYSPLKPLPCGAQVWIETQAEVEIR